MQPHSSAAVMGCSPIVAGGFRDREGWLGSRISFRINLGTRTLGFSAALVLSGIVLQGWGEGVSKAMIIGASTARCKSRSTTQSWECAPLN